MKLMFISHCHPPTEASLKNIGGMQRVSSQLEHYLGRRVELMPVVLRTSWSWMGMKTAWFMAKLVLLLPVVARTKRPDAILFSSMVTAGLAWLLRGVVHIPMIAIAHGQDVTLPVGPYQWLVRRIFACLDGVICVSTATREACLSRGLDPAKAAALGNGFDIRELSNLPSKHSALLQLRKNFGLDEKPMLLTVGRLVERKGHEWFIREVLPRLGDVNYVVIGDGPRMGSVRTAVEESGMTAKVHLLGRQPDEVLKAAYVAADLFIMPNVPVPGDMEGFGVVLLEANLAGTPAIASDLEGIRDVIANGQNGWRVEACNAGAFAHTIDLSLRYHLQHLSECARHHVLSRYDWNFVTARYIDFIEQITRSNEIPSGQTWELPYATA